MDSLTQQIDRTQVIDNSLAIWGLGQASVIIKGRDAVIAIDPYLSAHVDDVSNGDMKRNFPPPVAPQDLTNLDYVLITHEHMDHLDTRTLEPLLQASPGAKGVMPGWCREPIAEIGIDESRTIVPQALQPMTLPKTSIRLTAIPAAHEQIEVDPVKGHRWFGYLIEWNGVAVYHSGDNVPYDGYLEALQAQPKPDVAMLPINGRDYFRRSRDIAGNFHPHEAVQLGARLGWELLIPLHNDMYPQNSVPWEYWSRAIDDFAPRQRYKRLQPGEMLYYVKS